MDTSSLERKLAAPRNRKTQPTRHQELANQACDQLEPPEWREKVRPQYLKWYKKACLAHLEGELQEILDRTQSLYAKGKVTNRGRYFLSSAQSLLT